MKLEYEVLDILHDYRNAKNDAKLAKEQLTRIAVEELGIDQKTALSSDVAAILDGWLIGRGFQNKRIEEAA